MGALCAGAAKVGPDADEMAESLERACKAGDVLTVEELIGGTDVGTPPPWLTKDLANRCLLKNCSSVTHEHIVQLLIVRGNADPSAVNVYENNGLHLCALARNANESVLAHRYDTAAYLARKGCNIHRANRDGLTPLIMACTEENERVAMLLADRGAGVWTLYQWMSEDPRNSVNWVGGAVLCRYAFTNDEFVEGLRDKIMTLFDKDGDSKLNRVEMRAFLTAYAKVSSRSKYDDYGRRASHRHHRDPHGSARDTHRSFREMSTVRMRTAFKIDIERDPVDRMYEWKHILPLVQHYYRDTWNHYRPKDLGWASFRELTVETVAKVELQELESSAATRIQAAARGRHVRTHMEEIRETQIMERKERAARKEQERAAVRIQSIQRGNTARFEVKKLQEDRARREAKHRAEEARSEASALKIQAHYRGHSTRKLMPGVRAAKQKEKHDRSEAATKLQALQRGRHVRVRVMADLDEVHEDADEEAIDDGGDAEEGGAAKAGAGSSGSPLLSTTPGLSDTQAPSAVEASAADGDVGSA